LVAKETATTTLWLDNQTIVQGGTDTPAIMAEREAVEIGPLGNGFTGSIISASWVDGTYTAGRSLTATSTSNTTGQGRCGLT